MFDFEIMKKKKTEYIYVALNDIDSFGLQRRFLFEVLFQKYPTIENIFRLGAILTYDKLIYYSRCILFIFSKYDYEPYVGSY